MMNVVKHANSFSIYVSRVYMFQSVKQCELGEVFWVGGASINQRYCVKEYLWCVGGRAHRLFENCVLLLLPFLFSIFKMNRGVAL